MSTVKITELPAITHLNANTSNTLFVGVDIPSGATGKISATVLAHGLYSNNALNVGNNDILFPGVIGQFASNNENYLQINLQNLKGNGSSDFVATADIGTDTIYFTDLGIQGSTDTTGTLKPLDGYLIVQGNTAATPGGNLIVGAATPSKDILFVQGGYDANNIVAKFSYSSGLQLLQKPLTFADGTTQNTSVAATAVAANTPSSVANTGLLVATAAFVEANAAFLRANTPSSVANSAALYANGSFTQANAAFSKANNALANTTGTFAGSLTVTGTISTGNVTINNGVVVNDAGLFQYTTANNSTVTQATSKSTAVTCNGRTGQITTNNASLAKGATVSFTVNNAQIVSAKDVVIVNISSGATSSSYTICVDAVAIGSFSISITNNGAGPLAEALVINYAIIRVQ